MRPKPSGLLVAWLPAPNRNDFMTKKRDIQQEILAKLIRAQSLRYSEARPPRVENDLYNYHLQFLVDKGYVNKQNGQYSLSSEGKIHVSVRDPLSPTGVKADTFKLGVLTLVLDTTGSEIKILNQTRHRQPFYGQKGIMGGSIKKGEFVIEAAKRKLKVETGLDADFELVSFIRKVSVNKKGEIVSDVLFHLCIGVNPRGTLLKETLYGENFWASIDESIYNESSSPRFDKVLEILNLLKSNPNTKFSLSYSEERQVVAKI